MDFWRKNIPRSEGNKCKTPDTEVNLVCFRTRRKLNGWSRIDKRERSWKSVPRSNGGQMM